jgi:MFS superfamily sulfate permease-like transporter
MNGLALTILIGQLPKLFGFSVNAQVSVTAFLSVTLLGVLPGIAIAVGLSILNVFRRAWWPYHTVLGSVENLEGYHDIRSYPHARRLPGLVICRFDAPLFFANAKQFRDEIWRLAQSDPPPRWIVVAAEPITDVDTTASDVVSELDEKLSAAGIDLIFAEPAVAAFQRETGAEWTSDTKLAFSGQGILSRGPGRAGARPAAAGR